VLPARVDRKDAIFNAAHVALFLSAIKEKRYDLLGEAMGDRLHQPYRAKLVPGLMDVIAAARRAGRLRGGPFRCRPHGVGFGFPRKGGEGRPGDGGRVSAEKNPSALSGAQNTNARGLCPLALKRKVSSLWPWLS
jgi:hypothetical protein